MGLDMYLKGSKYLYQDFKNPNNAPKLDGYRVKEYILDLGYWRKHPNLHGYIVQTFAKGVDECQEIHLSPDDLKTIIKAVKEDKLPETEGFFFGKSDGSEKEDDLKIFKAALKWLTEESNNSSRDVIYQASW